MARKTTVTVYVVHKVTWAYNDEWYYRPDRESTGTDDEVDEYDGVDGDENAINPPVKAFRDRAKAEAHARALESKERARQSFPFAFEPAFVEDPADNEVLVEQIRQAGLNPPRRGRHGYIDFHSWWNRLSKQQRDIVWDLFDAIRFFEVIETEVELEE